MTTIKRLQTELTNIKKNQLTNISANPINDNLHQWTATIIGPSDTPYENGIFKLFIQFPEKYPFKPPKITFTTKIYHPNINSSGDICLDTLSSAWSPILTIPQVLLSISSLMASPNPDDPLVGAAAREYKNNRESYNTIVKEWTKKYAVENPENENQDKKLDNNNNNNNNDNDNDDDDDDSD